MRSRALLNSALSFARRRRRVLIAAGVGSVLALGLVGWLVVRALHRPEPASTPHVEPVSLGPLPRPSGVVTFTEGCMTARCHAPLSAAPSVHAPVTAHACDACHLPDAGGHRYPLKAPKRELCTSCHATARPVPNQHPAMLGDACLACHAPHGGNTKAMLIKATTPDTCGTCHPITDGAFKHAPYATGRCDLCHDPHGSTGEHLLLAGNTPDTCRSCHALQTRALETGTTSHKGLKGSCTGCHSGHAAPAKGLLAVPSREACLACHEDIAGAVASAAVSHEPVLREQACTRCHDAHGSQNPGMLRTAEVALCRSCHDGPQIAADKRTIPAIAAPTPDSHDVPGHGQCSSCHTVHGGAEGKLLRAASVKLPVGEYERGNYALCFSCHDFRLAESAKATQFRNGDRNLHEAHLKLGETSRGCGACHSVHSEGQPRLIGSSVKFQGSDWAMPMRFTLTPDGGRCGSGCHEELEYSRRPGGVKTLPARGAP